MKLLNADHEYDGLIRRETRTEEYELHEDLLLLAGYAEAAAKAAYLFEHTSYADSGARNKGMTSLKEAFSRLEDKFLQINGYEGAEKHD